MNSTITAILDGLAVLHAAAKKDFDDALEKDVTSYELFESALSLARMEALDDVAAIVRNLEGGHRG